MKNQPIWESSVRPLYVRSVWMEAQKGGIRGHRHFLLEEQCKSKKTLSFDMKKAHTFDFDDFSSEETSFELVGSSKNQLDSRTFTKPLALNRNKSAPGYRTFDEYSSKGLSKTSSLQDIPSVLSTNSHQDEKLAERVLQWMDLAKKSDPTQSDEVEPVIPLPIKKEKPRPLIKTKRPCLSNKKLRDPIKNVTIMFNKDIYSAKYNRVPRLNVHSNRKSSAGISSAKLPPKPIDKADMKKKERPKSCVTFEDELITDSEWSKKEIHIFIPTLQKNICGSNTFTEESLSTLCISDNKELL